MGNLIKRDSMGKLFQKGGQGSFVVKHFTTVIKKFNTNAKNSKRQKHYNYLQS
jgi:hypothetical protein